MSIPEKSRPGATGPRTPLGKKRSSQNSLKHGIFAKKVPTEVEKHEVFYEVVSGALQSQNGIEVLLSDQIARNLAQRAAIDQYSVRVQIAANKALAREWQEKADEKRMPPMPDKLYPVDPVPTYWRWRLLDTWKQEVVQRGCFNEQDLSQIDYLYGGKPTTLARALKMMIKLVLSETKARTTTPASENEANFREALSVLQKEIRFQKNSEKCEDAMESDIFASLPPDHEMEKCSRYRTANSKDLARLLANWETLRRLTSVTSNQRKRTKKRAVPDHEDPSSLPTAA